MCARYVSVCCVIAPPAVSLEQSHDRATRRRMYVPAFQIQLHIGSGDDSSVHLRLRRNGIFVCVSMNLLYVSVGLSLMCCLISAASLLGTIFNGSMFYL